MDLTGHHSNPSRRLSAVLAWAESSDSRAKRPLRVGRVDEIANLAAYGLPPIGQGIDAGVNTRVGSVDHAGSTIT